MKVCECKGGSELDLTFAMFCYLLFASIVRYRIDLLCFALPFFCPNKSGISARLSHWDATQTNTWLSYIFFRSYATVNTSDIHHKDAIPAPTAKFMIPASWWRFQLSQLINTTAIALPRVVVRFPHTWRASGRELYPKLPMARSVSPACSRDN